MIIEFVIDNNIFQIFENRLSITQITVSKSHFFPIDNNKFSNAFSLTGCMYLIGYLRNRVLWENRGVPNEITLWNQLPRPLFAMYLGCPTHCRPEITTCQRPQSVQYVATVCRNSKHSTSSTSATHIITATVTDGVCKSRCMHIKVCTYHLRLFHAHQKQVTKTAEQKVIKTGEYGVPNSKASCLHLILNHRCFFLIVVTCHFWIHATCYRSHSRCHLITPRWAPEPPSP